MKRTTVYAMPWNDEAVASLHPPSDSADLPDVIATGTLLSSALDLASRDATALQHIRIALPNRRHSPFSFQGMALMQLITVAREIAKAGDHDTS